MHSTYLKKTKAETNRNKENHVNVLDCNWNQQPYTHGTTRYLSSMKKAAALLPSTTALLFQKAGAQFSALLKQSRDLNEPRQQQQQQT